MRELKPAKLPDRVPVKMTFTAQPDFAHALRENAAVHRATYGEAESVEELIPFTLASFLESDRGFAKARKDVQALSARNAPFPEIRSADPGDIVLMVHKRCSLADLMTHQAVAFIMPQHTTARDNLEAVQLD